MAKKSLAAESRGAESSTALELGEGEPQGGAAKVFEPLHLDPTGQVALYQSGGVYRDYLESRFGQRFLEYRRLWRETSERGDPGGFPLSLDLAVNSGCQLSCLMCPLPSRPEARRVVPMDEKLYRRLMAQAREWNLPALTLGLASEPLLNSRVPDLIETAVKAGVMDIRLGTNGLLMSDEMSAALIDSGLTRLEISIDAAKAETYRSIRGESLERLERAIASFLNIRAKRGTKAPLLRLSFIKLKQNQGELPVFLEKWRKTADMISVQEPIWFPGSKLPPPEKPGPTLASTCAQSWQRLAVNFNGEVWPCCSWYGENLLSGNAAELDLASVWRSPRMERLRSRLSGAAGAYPPACLDCRA